MSTEKQKFFEQIRTDSNYSILRGLLSLIYSISVVLISFFVLILLYMLLEGTFSASPKNLFDGNALIFQKSEGPSFTTIIKSIFGLIAIICFGVGSLMALKIWHETSLVLIDIADSNLHSAYVNHATYLLACKRTKDA